MKGRAGVGGCGLKTHAPVGELISVSDDCVDSGGVEEGAALEVLEFDEEGGGDEVDVEGAEEFQGGSGGASGGGCCR